MKIEVFKGDITTLKIEAIVNAANTSLLGGGGVDGAIHKKGGQKLLDDCIKIRNRQGGCKTGEAVITNAGNLQANYVIHTVGPVWNNGKGNVNELLAACYKAVLNLCIEHKITTVAFPNISTGIYKFPKIDACNIAFNVVNEFKNKSDNFQVEKIIFVCYDETNYTIYKNKLIKNKISEKSQ